MDSQEFLIPLNGLASGRKHFRWSVGKKFFEEFGNADILDASLYISADAEKSGREVIVDGKVSGTVTVLCDRCMDDLVLPVDTEVRLEVRYEGHGDRPESAADDAGQEDDGEGLLPGRETVVLAPAEKELDMRQIIYDYVCLSLPMQRFHEEGGCNPSAIEILSAGIGVKGTWENGRQDGGNMNPFSALQDIFREKNDNNN